MREIEIKAKLHDKQKTIQKLNELGIKLSQQIKQHDVVYYIPGTEETPLDANWLRIRTQNDEIIFFTLKRSVTNQLDSIEHEIKVNDSIELAKILKYMGYEVYSELVKIRQKAKFEDIEICLDELPEAGSYIEAEILCNEDSEYTEANKKLWRLFETLGINKVDEETRGYDVILKEL